MEQSSEIVKSFDDFSTVPDFLDDVVLSASVDQSFDLVYTELREDCVNKALSAMNTNLKNVTRFTNYNSLKKRFCIRVNPSRIHEIHVSWMAEQRKAWESTGAMTQAEINFLVPKYREIYTNFLRVYGGSRKQPGFSIKPSGRVLPILVAESGWSESWSRMREDLDLWLLGGFERVKAVLLIMWERHPEDLNKIRGVAELHGLDEEKKPYVEQRETIFPVPAHEHGKEPPVIKVSREVLCHKTSKFDTEGTIPLDVGLLRDCAREMFARMGLEAA